MVTPHHCNVIYRTSARGFTLIEVLVAIAVFTVVGIMAMVGYNELVQQTEAARAGMQRVRAVQMTMLRMAQDFEQLEPRPVQPPLGTELQPCLLATRSGDVLAEFTRAGWSNPAGIQRSTLQRAAYRFADGKLIRSHWQVLDRTLSNEPIEIELLDKVKDIQLRFMTRDRSWLEQWPAPGAQNVGSVDERPIAIEIALELEDWGRIVRIVEVSG
jgi:general secretion pathway protein J